MITIEKAAYDEFMRVYKCKDGPYTHQRLGQAFYNHFDLHKCADQEQFQGLYEHDGDHAKATIYNVVTFS